jgi:hypothetical protein
MPRAIRTHPNRAITRTALASVSNRLRERARLQKARQRSAAIEATALARAGRERVHIMVELGAGSRSSLTAEPRRWIIVAPQGGIGSQSRRGLLYRYLQNTS